MIQGGGGGGFLGQTQKKIRRTKYLDPPPPSLIWWDGRTSTLVLDIIRVGCPPSWMRFSRHYNNR
jgi:hypothetical protein